MKEKGVKCRRLSENDCAVAGKYRETNMAQAEGMLRMKKEKGRILRAELKAMLPYWCWFAAAIIYWELLMKGMTGELTEGGFFFLCFVPAEALFLTFFEGWLKEKANRILMPVILAAVSVYYLIQTGYYKTFGSLFSVAMLGMGTDAVADFGWTVKGILVNSAGAFILVLAPVIISIVLELARVVPRRKFSVPAHFCSLAATAAVWFLGVGALMLGGTSRQSAYFAFSSSLMDTDTASQKIGASVTTLVEAGAYLFGIGGGESSNVISTGNVEILAPGDSSIVLGGLSGTGSSGGGSVSGGNSGGEYEDGTADGSGAADNAEGESGDAVSSKLPGTEDPQTADGTESPQTADGTDGSLGEEDGLEPKRRILEEINFKVLSQMSDDGAVQALCNYYSGVEGTMENEYSGFFEGYNLIYICAEGFWTYAIDEEVTPTLYKLANNGIILENYYNSFKNTTTNGEFAFLTSLWPDVSRDAHMGKDVGSFPQSSSKYMPYGLGNISSDLGYKAYGYHNYKGSYYKRSKSLPNLGLQCKFMHDGMEFTTNWPSSDLEMMEQSVDDYIGEEKFIAYYMTFSGHGPYDDTNKICVRNLEEVSELTADRGYSEQAVCYLSCNRELDKAMEYLLARLEEAGKADNTVIVLTGDHYPYYMKSTARNSLAGHKVDANFELYESTCIIYNAGMQEPVYNDAYCCNVDILPTVLNLLDIPYDSRMLAGTDVFAEGFHKAVLYNKSFVTDMVKYNAVNGNIEWLVDVSAFTEEELNAYIRTVSERIDAEYAASLNMLEGDFYRCVWENSGLLAVEAEEEQ